MADDILKIRELSLDEVNRLVATALEERDILQRGVRQRNLLQGKVVALVFEKPSLRTKVAFEVATVSLGGTPVFLASSEILASGSNARGRESIPDIARNLERFCDLIVARVYSHAVLEEIAATVKTPVVNALCDNHHPTQALADLMTIVLHKSQHRGRKVAFIGDGNNVATSLMEICALTGMHFAIASPKGYEIPEEQRSAAHRFAQASGTSLSFLNDPAEAVRGADVVYTDTFTSMGQEREHAERLKAFQGFCVTNELLSLAKIDAIFMHCLPAHRGEEVTSEVMDGPQSVVFDQAECRLHVAKAILGELLS